MRWNDRYGEAYDWATRFSDHIRDAVMTDAPDKLIAYTDQGRDAQLAQPSPDHYWPLLYVVGARLPGDTVKTTVDHIEYKSVGMTSFMIGDAGGFAAVGARPTTSTPLRPLES